MQAAAFASKDRENQVVGGETGLDGVWLDNAVVLNELDPVPSLAGQFSTFNSRPGAQGDGTPVWVGGIADTQGGSTQNRCLFSGFGANVLIKGGDALTGIADPVSPGSTGVDFDWRVSRFGTHWIDQIGVTSSSSTDGVMVIDKEPIIAGGGMIGKARRFRRSSEDCPVSCGPNGDGVIDAGDDNGRLADFTGIATVTVGARIGNTVRVYFTADIDFLGTPSSSDDLEGFFCIELSVGCPWDCDGNNDGIVSVTDLLALLGQYDPESPANCTGGACDFNADGCVDVVDLLKLLGHYDPTGTGAIASRCRESLSLSSSSSSGS